MLNKFGTAVILCGGKSSRMGFDKSNLKVKERLLIEVIADKLKEVFEEVILLTNDSEKFKGIRYKVFEDMIPDLGPISAIYSALKYASSRYIFITACDMPVVNLDFIRYMMEVIDTTDVEGVAARITSLIEPLYAFYSKDMIKTFESQIKNQNYRLFEAINLSKIYYIEESQVRKYSSNLDIFTNLNYQTDLTQLDKIFREDEGK
jgi:molybdenum cofactor guanylyltransferase